MAGGWLEAPYDLSGKRVWVAGHGGLVGSAMVRRLAREGVEVLTVPRSALDLREEAPAKEWIADNRPDVIVMAAAKVGGILANRDYPDEFFNDNMAIQNNIIHGAAQFGVEKLLFLGSSCIYPKDAAQPISEDALMSGALEPTNEAYARAKIEGIKLCQTYRAQGYDFITAMPCNLYGPHDRFDLERSHVLPALMMKAHAAKQAGADSLTVWGSGAPQREFLHADDLADALVFLLRRYSAEKPVNIGAGQDISIAELAQKICAVVGFKGRLVFDASKPDGVMRKLMDSSRIYSAGWRSEILLEDGLKTTYGWYREYHGYKSAA